MSEQQRQMTRRPQAQRVAAGKSSVLVVDDEPQICQAIERVLRRKGYDVTTATSGIDAVELTLAGRFDVILSDIQMPGMTGVDLLRVIRAYNLDAPVVLMTGSPTLESATDAVALGALQYLCKPIPNDALVSAIERATRHRVVRTQEDCTPDLEASFERALDSMWMAFQPIVDVKRSRVFGYEALMRSREPSLPHPGAVLEAAERLDKLPLVGQRVRELSAEAFMRAPDDVALFVNLHPKDLLDPSLYTEKSPLGRIADRVVLEITERAALDDVNDVKARASVLRYTGFRLAIDDLGAGYAGLSSFVTLEPDIVKLDMSLVRDAHKSPMRERLIESMATLCQQLNIQVIAEGIEVAEERESVGKAGCQLLQGYHFARPGPPFPEVSF